MDYSLNWVEGHLKNIAEATEKEPIPPFVLEVVMRDGKSYYVQDVAEWDQETGTAVLRIWDLRALSDQDKEIVKLKISNLSSKKYSGEGRDLHPNLDWANLNVNIKDIMYNIIWHDRMWPLGVEAAKMYGEIYKEKDSNK